MQGTALAPSRPEARQARGVHEPLVAVRCPPKLPRTAGGLSGRPFARIYPAWDIWMLELHPASGGWLPRPSDSGKEVNRRRLPFPSLAAAVRYAEQHGIDYRVVPPPVSSLRATLPRSWLARLARNGRRGDTYHG